MVIFIFLLVFSTTIAVLGSLTFWPVHHFYDFYIPIILFVGGYVFGLGLTWIVLRIFSLFYKKEKEYDHPSHWARYWLLQGLWYINFLCGIRKEVKGLNKYPTKEKCLVVCNHRSNFDPMLMATIFGYHDLAFICKESIFKIPFMRFLIACCYIPIDRNDRMKSLSAMKRATSLIETEATSIGVFPEGTRQHEKTLGDFHEGCFNIALNAKCPIVVITAKGNESTKRCSFLKPRKVILEVVDVIPYEDIEGKPAIDVCNYVKDIMFTNLESYYE